MIRFLVIIFTFLLYTSALAQPFGALTVTPKHPSPGLQLSWGSGPNESITINRAPWTFDNSIAPSPIATTIGTTYLDTTAVANTLYIYSVSQGSMQSNTFFGVISDITLPFNCPPMVPVDPTKLGVDRTVTFEAGDGSTVTFTVLAPVSAARLSVTVVPPCNGAGGCSDYTNIAAAIDAQRVSGIPGTIQLQAGNYIFTQPVSSANIFIHDTSDVILSGIVDINGVPLTHLYFTNILTGFPFPVAFGLLVGPNTNRVLVKDLTIDWQKTNAIPGIVTNRDSDSQWFTVQNPTYYIPDPMNAPTTRGLVGYRLSNRTYNLTAGARVGVGGTFNPNFAIDGLYRYIVPGPYMPNGTEAILYTPAQNPHGIQVGASTNVSFENVAIYGGSGAGIILTASGGTQRGVRLSNLTIDRKPDALLAPGEQPRYVALFGDSDSNTTLGDILIENSQFGLIDDDTFYWRGTSQVVALTSTSSFTTTTAPGYPPTTNSVVQFLDPVTLAQIGQQQPSTWVLSGGTWTVTFPAIPELERYVERGIYPVVTNPLWNSPNVVVQNSCSHDNHGRVFAGAFNGLIDNNVLANSYSQAINVQMYPTYLAEGTPPGSLVIKNNKLVGDNYGFTDLSWLGTSNGYSQANASSPLYIYEWGSTGFATPAPIKSLQIYDNFISNTNGLCITVVGAHNVGVVRNTGVDCNMVPYTANFEATYCGVHSQGVQPAGANQPWCIAKVAAQGSIMVAQSTDVDSTSISNTFLGTSIGTVFTDTTVTQTNISGAYFH